MPAQGGATASITPELGDWLAAAFYDSLASGGHVQLFRAAEAQPQTGEAFTGRSRRLSSTTTAGPPTEDAGQTASADAGSAGPPHRGLLIRFLQRGKELCGKRRSGPRSPRSIRTTVIGFPDEDLPKAVEDDMAVFPSQLEESFESSCPGTDARCIIMIQNPSRSRCNASGILKRAA